MQNKQHQWPTRILCTLVVCGLLACGGSTLTSSGVGSGGSGVAVGPVTGYGSIIVGGLIYDDTGSTTVERSFNGALQSTTTQLGDQVVLNFDANNTVQTIEVVPSLTGPVSSSYNDGTGLLEVLGQSVRIATNTDQNETATVVQGYDLATGSAQVPLLGDRVKVHGVWLNENSTHAPKYVLQATRIEKLDDTAPPTAFLLSGQMMGGPNPQSKLVSINSATGTSLQLARLSDKALQSMMPNTPITLWVTSDQWDDVNHRWRSLPITPLSAQASLPSAQVGQRLVLTGRVDSVDAATREMVVHGTRYTVPDNVSLPSRGQSVRMEMLGDTALTWQPQQLQVRQDLHDGPDDDRDNLGAQVSLRGITANPNWALTRPFALTLRGVTVQVDATTQLTGCSALAVNAKVQIQVKASRPSKERPQLTASQVTCSPA